MGEKTTFFKVHRKLLESNLWLSETFTKGQAWIDLIGNANFADSEIISGASVTIVKRGQLVTGENQLARRWGWSRKRTRNFLISLEKAEMLSLKRTSKGTVVTIENYEMYQGQWTSKGTSKGQQGDNKGTAEDTLNKNIKKNKEKKNIYGSCRNVCLSNSEYISLCESFPEIDTLIEEFSTYMQSTGKTYKDHFVTLQQWAKKNQDKANKAVSSFLKEY